MLHVAGGAVDVAANVQIEREAMQKCTTGTWSEVKKPEDIVKPARNQKEERVSP